MKRELRKEEEKKKKENAKRIRHLKLNYKRNNKQAHIFACFTDFSFQNS